MPTRHPIPISTPTNRPAGPDGPVEPPTPPVPGPEPLPGANSLLVAPLAEYALLGAAMTFPSHAAQILNGTDGGDFADTLNRHVHAAILGVLAQVPGLPEPAVVLAGLHAAGAQDHNPGTWPIRLATALHHACVPQSAPAVRRALIHARIRRQADTLARALHQGATRASLADLHTVLSESTRSLGAQLARLADEPDAYLAAPLGAHRPLWEAA